VIEIDHLSAHRRPAQGSRQQANDQRKPIALVASFHTAERQQHALVGPGRIGQRLALAVDHPAFRHGLALLRGDLDLAVGGDRCRHVEN